MRAAELGQSFLNEIMARAFDEASDKAGGEFRLLAIQFQDLSVKFCFGKAVVNGVL